MSSRGSNEAQRRAIGQRHQPQSESTRHDHDRHVANSQYPSLPPVNPPRRRLLNCTLPIPADATYASIFIAQTRYLRSQPTAHRRQRLRSMRSIALVALAQLTDRAQIPIAPTPRPRPTSRGFLPWRFSYAGPRCMWRCRHGAGIRKPSHERPNAPQQDRIVIRSHVGATEQ